MSLMRYTIVQENGGVSFVDDEFMLPALVAACATNPTALFVPCHRVVRTDGTLGGFLYGLDIKRALLDHEAKCA